MQRIFFETPTLADAAQRAAKVAPVKGVPWDRAAGVIVTATPDDPEHVTLMSTDLTVTFRTIITCLEMKIDNPVCWRLPSALFAGIVSALPMASGSTVTLAQGNDSWVFVVAGKSKAKLMPITLGSYPIIEPFDVRGLRLTPGLASRLNQVSWACATNDTALSGVHLDGKALYGCNKANLATVPCAVPVESPITAPLGPLSGLIRTAADVALRATDTRLEIMPDAYTQMTAILFADPYPQLKFLLERDLFTGHCSIPTEPFQAALNRMMVLVRGERLPRLKLKFSTVLELDMNVEEVGRMVDEIEVTGNDEVLVIEVTPNTLLEVLEASGRPVVKCDYGPDAKSPLKFTDDNGFLALVTPRVTGGSV